MFYAIVYVIESTSVSLLEVCFSRRHVSHNNNINNNNNDDDKTTTNNNNSSENKDKSKYYEKYITELLTVFSDLHVSIRVICTCGTSLYGYLDGDRGLEQWAVKKCIEDVNNDILSSEECLTYMQYITTRLSGTAERLIASHHLSTNHGNISHHHETNHHKDRNSSSSSILQQLVDIAKNQFSAEYRIRTLKHNDKVSSYTTLIDICR